jgi:hypothetical protein
VITVDDERYYVCVYSQIYSTTITTLLIANTMFGLATNRIIQTLFNFTTNAGMDKLWENQTRGHM